MSSPGWARRPTPAPEPERRRPAPDAPPPLPWGVSAWEGYGPPVVWCTWWEPGQPSRELLPPYGRLDGCRGARRRPPGLEPHEPTIDCGAPPCVAKTAAYRAELAAAGPKP